MAIFGIRVARVTARRARASGGHCPEYRSVGRAKDLLKPPDGHPRAAIHADDDHAPGYRAEQGERIAHRQGSDSVKDHQIRPALQLLHDSAHRLRAEQSSGIRRRRAGREHLQATAIRCLDRTGNITSSSWRSPASTAPTRPSPPDRASCWPGDGVDLHRRGSRACRLARPRSPARPPPSSFRLPPSG